MDSFTQTLSRYQLQESFWSVLLRVWRSEFEVAGKNIVDERIATAHVLLLVLVAISDVHHDHSRI